LPGDGEGRDHESAKAEDRDDKEGIHVTTKG
jgi:hypothetical protein